MTTGELRALGDRLRRAGLTQHALLGWAGTRRLAGLGPHTTSLAAGPVVPAATALAVFVGGAEIELERLAQILPIEALLAAELVDVYGGRARAKVSILPIEASLLVCDRHDGDATRELVMWPDDSSYHLAHALAGARRERWIDLATGSAFAPMARPALAADILGTDLNPRAVHYARLGAALSGIAHFVASASDIGAALPARAPLVTCNAPIVDDPDCAIWRHADRGFFARLWDGACAASAPGGEVVVHCTLDALPEEMTGTVATVVYSPPGIRAYAVTWWVPDAPDRRVVGQRALTPARPHVDPRDRADVLAGSLPPLHPGQV